LGGRKLVVDRVSRIPRSVSEFLNVSDVNFQDQFEAKFWFCDSPGEVSRKLNGIINLSEIDDVLGRAAKEVRKSKLVVEVCRERLRDAEAKVRRLAHVPELNKNVLQLEALEAERLSIHESRARMAQIRSAISRANQR